MCVSVVKDRKCAALATVRGLTKKFENLGHELYMDNFFSSLDSFDNLHSNAINCCGTIRPN
jgi:hypothetical protein